MCENQLSHTLCGARLASLCLTLTLTHSMAPLEIKRSQEELVSQHKHKHSSQDPTRLHHSITTRTSRASKATWRTKPNICVVIKLACRFLDEKELKRRDVARRDVVAGGSDGDTGPGKWALWLCV